ncbi:hypothetical protein AFCA_008218 [Aspergillus flavus]|uniref:Uncharacterized protein n=1 Tax=Aspergillus flavus TaxID=5059 RepID=A0AB74BQJ0_ASPFL|nr:hypothetical protein CA14_006484 [Aspergillus flavus]UDD60831.1 hypothetical protein AFCA_008218 [Aspergillus flavus]
MARPEPESHAKRHYFIAKFKRDKLGVPLDAREHTYLIGPPIEVDGYLSKDIELYEQGYRHDYDILEKLYRTSMDPLDFYIFMMNQRKVINDHATDVSSAHHVCTAKYHERFIALVAGVEDLRDIQAKDPCFLEYEYEFDMPPSSGYYSDSSDAEESGEDGDEPANVYGSDLDFQEKWRIYHLKRNKIMGLCQSLHFARGKEVKSITSP